MLEGLVRSKETGRFTRFLQGAQDLQDVRD